MKQLVLAALAAWLCACASSSGEGDTSIPPDAGDLSGDITGEEVDGPVDVPDSTTDVAGDPPDGRVPDDHGKDIGPAAAQYEVLPLAPAGGLFAIRGWDGAAIAVGAKGAIVRRQGTLWTPMKSPVNSDLHAVFGETPDDVWAAGADGVIIRWNGQQWAPVDPGVDLPEGVAFRGAWGAEGHLFLVGDKGTVLHGADGVWKLEQAAVTYDLHSIWGASLLDIYAGAAGGTVLRRIGGAWTSVQVSGGADVMRALHGLSSTELWAGGDHGALVVYEGGKWTPKVTNDMAARTLHAAWAFGAKDVWFIGEEGVLIHSAAGGKWNLTDIAGPYYRNHTFYGLFGWQTEEQTAALAVGEKGAMLLYDGETWKDESSAPAADINDLAGLSALDALAVGADGLLLAWDGAAWRGLDQVAGRNLAAVAAVGDSYVAVAHDGSIVHVDDGGGEIVVEDALVDAKLLGVCAPTDKGWVTAVGEKGRMFFEDKNGAWNKISTGVFDSLRDCAVDEEGVVTVVGDAGRVLQVDGDEVTPLPVATLANLQRVALAPDGAVYAVGDNGVILKGSGTAFSKVYEEPGLFLYGVHAFADRVVAVGWAGRIVVYHPDTAAVETHDVEAAGVLLQVWGPDPSHQFVVGKKGKMLEYQEGSLQ